MKNKVSDLSNFSLEDIIGWRNDASSRVTSNRKIANELEEQYIQIGNQYNKIDKKIMSDIHWIQKLNRHLKKRVLKRVIM